MNFMDNATAEKAQARRMILLPCAFITVGVALPLVAWWLGR